MNERILDEFSEFDDPPPFEHKTESALLMRQGKKFAKQVRRHRDAAARTIGARQRQSYSTRKTHPKITLATKA